MGLDGAQREEQLGGDLGVRVPAGDEAQDVGLAVGEPIGQSGRGLGVTRRILDTLTSAGGAVLVVVLILAGGLLTWGHSFVNSNVHNQLARQQITFPSKTAFAHPKAGTEITASMIPSVSKYAGQQLTTGPQAEAYADDFIAVHQVVNASPGAVLVVHAARDDGA
jgi:hypothetical protein